MVAAAQQQTPASKSAPRSDDAAAGGDGQRASALKRQAAGAGDFEAQEAALRPPAEHDGKRGDAPPPEAASKSDAPAPKREPWKSYPVLYQGYQSAFVRKLQTLLGAAGYACETSGVFAKATVEALKKFQADNGLKADGACGGTSWQKLFEKAGPIGLGPAEKDPPDPRISALAEGKFAGKGKYKGTGDGFEDADLDALLAAYGEFWKIDVRAKAPTRKQEAGPAGGQNGVDGSGRSVEGHPAWVTELQAELISSSEWTPDHKASQKLLQAYLDAWSSEGGALNATAEEFYRHVGKSQSNGQSGVLGGGKGAMNWCQDASTRALLYGMLRKGVRFATGGRPKKLLEELTHQTKALARWTSKAKGAQLYNRAAWQAEIFPGDQISVVGSGPLTGHAATAIAAHGDTIVYASGNAGGGIPNQGTIKTDQVTRTTPPDSYAEDRPKIEAKSGATVRSKTFANNEKQARALAEKNKGNAAAYAKLEAEAERQGGMRQKADEEFARAQEKYPDIPVDRKDHFVPGKHAPKNPGEVWVVAITRTSRLDANALLHMGDEALAKEGLERCDPLETAFPDWKQVMGE
ncbi:MAG: peptidoglycan-binding domain-containing protein [Myxococcota bacterium]